MKRWSAKRADYSELYRNRIRRILTVLSYTRVDCYESQSTCMLKVFMLDNYQNENVKSKIRKFYKHIHFISRRIRDQLCTREAKTDVLVNYWDKLCG
jgi:hypothetical protein